MGHSDRGLQSARVTNPLVLTLQGQVSHSGGQEPRAIPFLRRTVSFLPGFLCAFSPAKAPKAWLPEGRKGSDLAGVLCAWWLPLGKQPQWEGQSFLGPVTCQKLFLFYPHPGPWSGFSFGWGPWGNTPALEAHRACWQQGLQSALVGPLLLNFSWAAPSGKGMHSSPLIFPTVHLHISLFLIIWNIKQPSIL